MKPKCNWSSSSLKTKIRLLFAVILCVSILFSFLFIHYLYRNLYVNEVEQSLLDEGLKLKSSYTSGEISDEFKSHLNWYNTISESEILLVNNPRELSACLPFEINHEGLISEEERRNLLRGEHLIKIGYEERFDRQIMGVVVPLLDENKLVGIIYLYLPLAPIEEVFNRTTPLLIAVGIIFFLVIFKIVNSMSNTFLQPIHEMRKYAKELAKGNFKNRIPVRTSDEIGGLAKTFNQMSEALDQSDQKKKDFLANVAHELRTPLSYVKGYSGVLQEKLYETEDEAEKYLSLIQRESERMQRLVNDLLDLAQLEGENYPLIKEPIAFSQLVNDTVDRFDHRLQEKHLMLQQHLDDEIIIIGSPDRLQQIIYNLLENAIRYSDKPGTISLSSTQDQESIFFSISDNGMGMSEEEIMHIGERFYRTDKARNRKEGGTGLGLAIVKQLVLLHGGRMEFHSKLGKGTTVTLVFPNELNKKGLM
ncbi:MULTISPECIES: sensor histidine kinase [Bacillaceae]|uniref:sensor histidine kinase n=1 Tax=Bacillaceae TaxID=186817 RepID=UPI001E459835|nr:MULTISPECIES: ATP-binding protein [Bacillaceae]UGB29891.1 cell wall metabolism sensor histidine kinase WalK [Metabacillus sp. B2-18]